VDEIPKIAEQRHLLMYTCDLIYTMVYFAESGKPEVLGKMDWVSVKLQLGDVVTYMYLCGSRAST
jgi:hypothetical protein